jgi:uracil-DNA glycosylase
MISNQESLHAQYLNAMGIQVWVQRNIPVPAPPLPVNLMFITEAPKENEKAEKIFDAMLYAIDLKNKDINMTYICDNFLEQIALIKPRLIVALGRIAAHELLKTDTLITQLRNQVFEYGNEKIPLIVTYHPKYLLHRPTEKANAWQDLQLISKTLANLKS